MANTQGQVTIDESDTVDKRLQTLTRVEGGTGQTVHNEVFCLIDPDDGADDSLLRILAADPASGDRGMVVRDIGPAIHARNDAFGNAMAVGGELDDSGTVAATEGNVSPARITAQRALHVNLRNNAGTEIATTAAPLGVQIGDGTDQAAVTGSSELSVLATAQPGVDVGDVTINNANGGSAVHIQDGGNVITVDGTVTSDAGTGTRPVEGEVAHDGAAANANPVLIGGYVSADEPTAVTTDVDSVRAWFEKLGRQVMLIGHANPEAPNSTTITASGNNTLIAAPGASTHLVIYKGFAVNSDNSNVTLLLQDGAGGTTRVQGLLGKNGGGWQFDFGSRGWELGSNTLLNASLSGTSDVDVNITEYAIVAD